MELWSTHHGSSSSAELRKAGGEYSILSVTLGSVQHNISLDRKEMKDLFNALGNEIGCWDEKSIVRTPRERYPWEDPYRILLTGDPVEVYIDLAIVNTPELLENALETVRAQHGDNIEITYYNVPEM